MTTFIIIFIVLSVLYLVDKNLNPKNKIGHIFIYIMASIVASYLVGNRHLDAGFDTKIYVAFYESIEGISFKSIFSIFAYNFQSDYLFVIWNYLISKLGLSSSGFIYITAVASVFFFLLASNKLFSSENLLVFLGLYSTPGFIMLFGNAMRQGMALPVFILAIHYFLNRKYLFSGILVIVTSLFHTFTGLILAFTLFLSFFTFRIIEHRKLLIFIGLLFLQPIILLFQKLIYSVYPSVYLTIGSFEYFYHYAYIIFLLLYIILNFKLQIKNQKIRNLFSLYTILSIIISSFWFNQIAYGRVLYLAYPFMLFFTIYMFSFIKERRLKYMLLIVFLLAGIYFFMTDSTQITLN